MTIPRMLAEVIGTERTVAADGATVAAVLEALTVEYPALRVHLFDEDRRLREHVRCFRNDRTATLDEPITADDTITILQAVSGG